MTPPLFMRNASTLFTSVGDDIVALSVQKGQCYGMEQVTATVWNLLERPIGIDEIATKVSEVYDVETDQCRADIEQLVAQLKDEGLVTIVEPSV